MDKTEAIKIAEKYIKILKENNYNFKNIFLFGSFAKGNYREDSDIDIAVILENLENIQDELLKLMKFRRKVDERIEPHPIDNKNFDQSNPFVNDIVKFGIKIV